MNDFEEERELLETSVRNRFSSLQDKMQDLRSLYDAISSESKQSQVELQSAYDCHTQYDAVAQNWLTWFAKFREKLYVCQTSADISLNEKNARIQVMLVLMST